MQSLKDGKFGIFEEIILLFLLHGSSESIRGA